LWLALDGAGGIHGALGTFGIGKEGASEEAELEDDCLGSGGGAGGYRL